MKTNTETLHSYTTEDIRGTATELRAAAEYPSLSTEALFGRRLMWLAQAEIQGRTERSGHEIQRILGRLDCELADPTRAAELEALTKLTEDIATFVVPLDSSIESM